MVEKYGYTGICSGKQPLIFHGNKLEIRDAPGNFKISKVIILKIYLIIHRSSEY